MAKKSKAQSPIVPIHVARHTAREQLRNADHALVQRHQAALHAIDSLDRGAVIRDLVSSRGPKTAAAPMATPLPEPAPRPMATRIPPHPDTRALIGIAISTTMVVAAILGAAWLAKP